MTPLLNPSPNAEKRYDEAHLKTRNTVERTFGVWKRRFPCLSQKLRLNFFERAMNIIPFPQLEHTSKAVLGGSAVNRPVAIVGISNANIQAIPLNINRRIVIVWATRLDNIEEIIDVYRREAIACPHTSPLIFNAWHSGVVMVLEF
ncbi:unnamed protein product [Leptidea sinapis]|uniref:DDE Tnp4 domain-containing protein n=1 Tax=Leptidea sinapis TaxID=189913 RepID=A0A5E4PX79_9NEOP|nr:unnamed protein product [Leptidea sinapis]